MMEKIFVLLLFDFIVVFVVMFIFLGPYVLGLITWLIPPGYNG